MMYVRKDPENKAAQTPNAAALIQAVVLAVVPLVAKGGHRGTKGVGTDRRVFWKEAA